MLYEIRTYGDSCLTEKSEKVENITEEIRNILDNMVETMHEATGVGLAAPQIGINKRFFVLDVGDKIIRKIINPEILEMSEDYTESDEGCLSVPGIYKKVKRAARIKVKYQNENGKELEEEMIGFLAKAFQHEYDHLEGKLFIERISPVSRKIISKKLQLIKKETEKKLKK